MSPGEFIVGASATGVLQTYANTAVSGGPTSITLPSSASTTDGDYVGQQVRIASGLGAGQTLPIATYNGITRLLTTTGTFSPSPNNTSSVIIYKLLNPDLQLNHGTVIYFDNRNPLPRAADQSERIRLIILY